MNNPCLVQIQLAHFIQYTDYKALSRELDCDYSGFKASGDLEIGYLKASYSFMKLLISTFIICGFSLKALATGNEIWGQLLLQREGKKHFNLHFFSQK